MPTLIVSKIEAMVYKWTYENERKRLFWNQINTKHPFHLVEPSFWPFFLSLGILWLILFLPQYWWTTPEVLKNSWSLSPKNQVFYGLWFIIIVLAFWWYDVLREACIEKKHTLKVQNGLKLGFILFILSEIMFFVSFFWAFFHSSLVPSVAIGCIWPPKGIEPIDPLGLPAWNTLILLLSGVTLTKGHHSLSSLRLYRKADWVFYLDWDCKFIDERILTPKLWKQYLLLRVILKVYNGEAIATYYHFIVPEAEKLGYNLGGYNLIEAGTSLTRFMHMLKFLLDNPKLLINKKLPIWMPVTSDDLILFVQMLNTLKAIPIVWFKEIRAYVSLTIFLGCLFLFLQLIEYRYAPFAINDSVYGSLFFVMTGFHGLHVFIGVCYLIVSYLRLFPNTPLSFKIFRYRTFSMYSPLLWSFHCRTSGVLNHFYTKICKQYVRYFRFCVGFETAAWYWHFVDIVWLFLYFIVYIWGS